MSKATVKVPLFNFHLREIGAIAPLGGDRPRLHWFGLTDGWYWLSVAGTELLRYSDDLIASSDGDDRQRPLLPYADYYVARLWEDVIDQLPNILDPVPRDVIERFTPERWNAWVDDRDDDAASETFVQAVEWWHCRRIPTGYLRDGPGIWCWTVGDVVHIRWESRRQQHTGRLVWAASDGAVSLPTDVFVAEVRSFDRRLITAMGERVEQVQQRWRRADIALDVDGLIREHIDRTTWLDRMLSQIHIGDVLTLDWNPIRQAIVDIEALVARDVG